MTDSNTQLCECVGLGFCSRYKRDVTHRDVAFCRSPCEEGEQARQILASGGELPCETPQTTLSERRAARGIDARGAEKQRGTRSVNSVNRGKPGTELKKSLAWIAKIKPATATCNCENLAAEMDKEGVKKCRERREYYVGRMLENKTAIVEAMKAEGGVNGMLGVVAGVVPHMIAVAWIGHKFDAACDAAEVKAKPKASTRRRSATPRGAKMANSPTMPGEPIAFTDIPRLTLMFHVWPHGDSWKRHIEKLEPVLHRFERLLLGVATDVSTATMEETAAAFGDRWEVTHVVNNPEKRTGLREVATYRPMIEALAHGVNDVTFCAHGKGVQGHNVNSDPVTWWTDAMYDTILHNIDGVLEEMRNGAAIVGSFRRHGSQLGTTHRWHYSGTFYAFRNSVAFSNGVPQYRQNWWGTESWPGDHFPLSHSACIFGDQVGDMYKANQQPRAAFEQWKANR
jgi:hypothetical protein